MAQPVFRLYDTLSREVKPLKTLDPGHLKFYSCGPTVYSYAHIGNFRTFLTADLVVRTARALGWEVSYVSNITDVGHLTEDDQADATGEDKMAKALRSKEGESFMNVWELAAHYAEAFKSDWRKLNLLEPMLWPRATEHMREQILAVEELIKNGHAYETPTGVYFRLSSFPEHGKLSGNVDKEQLFTAVRDVVVDDNKEHPGDFALWKKDEKHLMQWYSPWGWGFPGWHIECSAMAMMYLGETIDLHGGGEDLVFPHHESEIAQSEALTGKAFCNHWIHTRFLQVEGEKMSKSKGNWFTVRDLVDKERVNPLAVRYALISVPYGKPLNFTRQTLSDAEGNIAKFEAAQTKVAESDGDGENVFGAELDDLYNSALEAMCDDLNTSVAIAKALEGANLIRKQPRTLGRQSGDCARQYLAKINELLGIVSGLYDLQVPNTPEPEVDKIAIEAQITRRTQAKSAKDFGLADQIRQELLAQGIELRDTPEGTEWVLKKS